MVVAFTSVGRGGQNYPEIFFTQELSPIKAPENVTYVRSSTVMNISWDPLTLFEARGFPIYTVTLTPLSLVSDRATRQSDDDGIILVTTNETDVVIEDLDPDVEYSLTVAVETSAGKVTAEGIMVGFTNKQSSIGSDDDNSSTALTTVLVVFAVVSIIIIFIVTVYLRRKQKNKPIRTSLGMTNPIYDEMELQSDSTFHENSCAEKDLPASCETAMSESPQSQDRSFTIHETPANQTHTVYLHERAIEKHNSIKTSTELESASTSYNAENV